MADSHRKQMRIPNVIMDRVETYKKKNGLTNTTAAFLELVRKGLDTEKDEEKEAS